MEIIAGVGGGAFVVVSLVLGTRLLLMAQRTRKLPELCMGACLLLMGGVGYPLITVVQQATQVAPELRAGVLVVQMLCHVVGNLGLAVFTMRVFRPEAAWSRAAAVAITGATLVLAMAQILAEGLVAFAVHGTGAWRFHSAVALVNLAWAGVESMRYHLQLERRLRLGLADPVVSDRLRLWALGMLAAARPG